MIQASEAPDLMSKCRIFTSHCHIEALTKHIDLNVFSRGVKISAIVACCGQLQPREQYIIKYRPQI